MSGSRSGASAKRKAPERDPEKLDRTVLAKAVLHYALRRARVIALMFRNSALADVRVAEDAACDAVASLFGGKRKWNPDKVPDASQHVRSTVNSLLWNLAVSAAQSKGQCSVDDVELADTFDPETLVIAREQDAWEKVVHERVMELVLEDDELLALYSCVEREGTDKPAIIARKLNISPREVDNRKRRLNALCARACAAVATEKGRS